jgi:hypothetical protein
MAEHMRDVPDDEQGLFTTPEDTADLSGAAPDAVEYFLPSGAYDVLKWVGLILCPALATLVGTVGPQWGLENAEAIVTTINAIGLFVGACIGASHVSARSVE